MTPPPATSAARAPRGRAGAKPRRASGSGPKGSARGGRSLRSRPAGRAGTIPRRVSGGGSAAAAATAAAPALAARGAAVARPIGLRVVRGVAGLPDNRMLDPLVRGRWWIGLVGFLLIGIVAMQVSLLSMNSGIGRSVERASELERANGALRGQVSRLGARERVQAEAARLGMVMPSPGQVKYIAPNAGRDATRAAEALSAGAFGADAVPATSGEDAYADDGSGDTGYAEDGSDESAYAEDGSGESGYAEDGGGESGYAEDGSAESGYAEDGSEESAYSEQGGGEETASAEEGSGGTAYTEDGTSE